jgi:hypothetical protein
MNWTHEKPTIEGYYWVGQEYSDGFSAEIKCCSLEDDDDPCLSWVPEWDEGPNWQPIDDDSPKTMYYGPITFPIP